MWTCPICGNTGTGGCFCGYCRFDLSTDAVAYPTFCELPPAAAAERQRIRQRWQSRNSSYSVQKEQIVDGKLLTGTWGQPVFCPEDFSINPPGERRRDEQVQPAEFDAQAGAYAVPGSQVVDSRVRTGEEPDPAWAPGNGYAVPGSQVVDGRVRTGGAPDGDGGRSEAQTVPGGSGGPGEGSYFHAAGDPGGPETRSEAQPAPGGPGARKEGGYFRAAGAPGDLGSRTPPGPDPRTPPVPDPRTPPVPDPATPPPVQPQPKKSGKAWLVIRIILTVYLGICSLGALVAMTADSSGDGIAAYVFTILLCGGLIWLMWRRKKPKTK